MLEKLKQWWQVDRHIRALESFHLVVVSENEYESYRRNVADFVEWVERSGSMNDGSVPNHTKKTVQSHARTLRYWFPKLVGGSPDGA